MSETRNERFMAKVAKTPTCWNWTGSQSGSGYGQFWNGERSMAAHWFLLSEQPKGGLEACHKCDNRLCVNPDHIFLGTRSDNMRDMFAKGRGNPSPGTKRMLETRTIRRGQENHQSRLTDDDVAQIKTITPAYGRGAALAKHFGVSQTVISGIWKGSRWSHIKPAAQRCEGLLRVLGRWKE